MHSSRSLIAIGLLLCFLTGFGHAQMPNNRGEPYPEALETLDGQLEYLCSLFEPKNYAENQKKGMMRQESGIPILGGGVFYFQDSAFYSLAGTIAEFDDPKAIPYLIGAIDADNSYATVYGIGHFGLGKLTGVEYTMFHDGAFWKRWWEKNKTNFPEEIQKIEIPELPRTPFGKAYQPFSEKLETLDGLLEYLCSLFEPENYAENQKNGMMFQREDGLRFQDGAFYNFAQTIARFDDPKAIPYLIGVIDADNSYSTVFSFGQYALRDLTGVRYNVFHDGAFWRRWWEKNKANFPEEVQKITIPELPKTDFGRTHVPFPAETETLQGQLLFLQSHAKRINDLPWDDPLANRLSLHGIANSISEFNDPTAIPYLIAILDIDSNRMGDFIGNKRSDMNDISSLLGSLAEPNVRGFFGSIWWKNWWEENKHTFPEAVQKIPIPSIHDEWKIPGLSDEVAQWHQEKKETDKRDRYEKMLQELAESDVGEVPAERLHVAGNEKMEYFLIGVDPKKPVPESGYHLVIVLPGGDGSADFHPFVRRIWKYAMDETNFVIAQPIAVHWSPNQQVTWTTEKNKVDTQEFSTELFVESVVTDVAERVKIDPKYVFTLSWSSGGPAAYAIALQEKTAITGSYIVMSVFKPELLPPLENAKGKFFAIQHSPDDRVCPFRMAKDAEEQLLQHGAQVKLTEYPGGHGWSGNVYGLIRENLAWLVLQTL